MVLLKHAGDQFIITGLIDGILIRMITIHVLLLKKALVLKRLIGRWDFRTHVFINRRKIVKSFTIYTSMDTDFI